MLFIPPDKRSYDRDNLVARMKSGIDGLADALRINDKRFNTVISTTVSYTHLTLPPTPYV